MTSRLGRAAQAELRGARWMAWPRKQAPSLRRSTRPGPWPCAGDLQPFTDRQSPRPEVGGQQRQQPPLNGGQPGDPPRSRRACCPAWTPARRLAGVDLAGKDAEIGPPPETARARGRTTGRGRPDTGGVVQAQADPAQLTPSHEITTHPWPCSSTLGAGPAHGRGRPPRPGWRLGACGRWPGSGCGRC